MAVQDKKVHKFLTVLLCFTYAAGYVVLFIFNDEPLLPVGLLTVTMALSVFSHTKYYTSDKVDDKGKIILIIQAVLVFLILYFDNSTFELIFILLLVGDCVYAYSYKFSGIYTLVCFAIYYPLNYLTYPSQMGFSYSEAVLRDIVIMFFILTTLYLSRIQLTEKAKYNHILNERNNAFEKLNEYSQKIEEMAMYEERSRISYMLHNSIGHKLAAMSLSLQAKKAVFLKSNKLDENDFESLETQLQETIELLHKTIESSSDFLDTCDIYELLDMLVSNIQNDITIEISKNIDINEEIPKQLNNLIYNIILESTTNAIKHSECSNIFIDVITSGGDVIIKIHDDGLGFDDIVYGYGITKLKENVEKHGGKYNIQNDNGCCVTAIIPLEEAV